MRNTLYKLLLIIGLNSFALSVQAQTYSDNTDQLEFLLSKNPEQLYLIKLKNGFSFQGLKSSIVIGYYSKDIAIVKFSNTTADIDKIKSWSVYLHQYKYPSLLLDWAVQKDGKYNIYIKTFSDIDFSEVQKNLQQLGIDITPNGKWKGNRLYDIWIEAAQLPILASQSWIASLDAVTEMEPLNAEARSMTHTRIVQAPISIGGEQLSGKGVVMGIGDDGIIKHADIDGRIIENFNPNIGSSHATHVSVTAVGAGIKDELLKGFAPEAKIINQIFNGILIYGPSLNEKYQMNITNNSYAARTQNCDFAGRYTSESQALDEMAWSHPKLLHVFAAGNDGNRTCPPFATGFATTVGAYQPSKNTLTVANLGKTFSWYHPSSSKGPIKDGRIKPEIAAIGRGVMSGAFNNTYALNTGTSMSSPNVAGAAALLTEKYQAMHGSLPDAALLKTLLMNGSMDIYNPGPDFKYGFGLMDVYQSVNMLKNNRYTQAIATHGSSHNYTITIPENVSKVKFMLYWNDTAAIPTPEDPTIPKLINDLDMNVTQPGGGNILPWVLDPTNPDNHAVRGLERTNNVEQVSIDFPLAGTYQINIQGFNVVSSTQPYVVAWDFEMDAISMLFPIGGEALKAGDSMYVYFKSPTTSSTFSCLLSTDNGSTWTTLTSSILATDRHYTFKTSETLHSTQCKIRIVENSTGKTVSSENFTISSRITVSLAGDASQCPGSITTQWTSAPSTTAYAIFIEKDQKMIAIDTVPASQLKYTYSGLMIGKTYWVSVAPIFGSATGLRAIAINSMPNFGDCIDTDLPAMDVALTEIKAPKSGRILTSSSLSNSETIAVTIQNRGRNTVHIIELEAVLNGGIIGSQAFSINLLSGHDTTLLLSEYPVDLSTIGDYSLKVYSKIISSSDAYAWNDTIIQNIYQIDNQAIDINEGYVEGFESVDINRYTQNKIGISGADKWDFEKTPGYGRISSYVNEGVSITGAQAMSLDLWDNTKNSPDSSSTNSLIVTLNLADYDVAANEVRTDFLYRFSGRPKTLAEQSVYLRGSDVMDWIPVMTLDTTFAGTVKSSSDISLNDFLLANGHTFSSSTQLKIDQKDTSLITDVSYGNGLTIDSFRLYAVTNDLAIMDIKAPSSQGCELNNNEKIQIAIRNNVFYDLADIPVAYQLNDGAIVMDTIPFISAKSTMLFTFDNEEDFSELGTYLVNVWVAYPDDDFRNNDSLLRFKIHHQPIITEYPYIETFENSDGFFYTNDSSAFQWNQPNINVIKTAANGQKAWNSSLSKDENTRHTSYLYSPCFDISSLTSPMLSMSITFNGPTSDSLSPGTAVYVEYATDGKNWKLLGSHNPAYNWYNLDKNVWAAAHLPWQNASQEIPKEGDVISFRFVLESYPGNVNSGFAVDDIHIYEKDKTIGTEVASNGTTLSVNANSSISFEAENKYINLWSPDNLGNTKLEHNIMNASFTYLSNEAIVPVNWIVNPTQSISKNYRTGVYIPHKAIEKLQNPENCYSCYIPKSIYELGISAYTSSNADEYNNKLDDNSSGKYGFIPKSKVYYLPYMNGYLVQYETQQKGEFWFYSGGISGSENIGVAPINLSGTQLNNTNFKLLWNSEIDSFISQYTLERKKADGAFETIHTVNGGTELIANYEFVDKPPVDLNPLYYRLRYTDKLGKYRYTNEVSFTWNKMGTFSLYPNPANEHLIFTWNLDTIEEIKFQMIDIQGRVYSNGKIPVEQLIGSYAFNLQEIGLAPGVHILQLQIGKEKWAEKFVYVK